MGNAPHNPVRVGMNTLSFQFSTVERNELRDLMYRNGVLVHGSVPTLSFVARNLLLDYLDHLRSVSMSGTSLPFVGGD